MTTDRYTKVVLTIIALSLSIIAIQLTTKEAHANQQSFRFTKDGLLMTSTCQSGRGGDIDCSDGTRFIRN